jgi:hypothetical protein
MVQNGFIHYPHQTWLACPHALLGERGAPLGIVIFPKHLVHIKFELMGGKGLSA